MKYAVENITKIDTYIEEYNKSDETINREYLINNIELNTLRRIFGVNNPDNEIYYVYSINIKESEVLNQYLTPKIKFDFNKYDYFLQRYAEFGDK